MGAGSPELAPDFPMEIRMAILKRVKADNKGVTWKLPENDLWNVPPKGVHQVHFEIKTREPWGEISHLRGLVIDKRGYVYGHRSLQNHYASGYAMEGRISVGGRLYRAFTTNTLFERPDGSLCSVACLYLCTDGKPWPEKRRTQ